MTRPPPGTMLEVGNLGDRVALPDGVTATSDGERLFEVVILNPTLAKNTLIKDYAAARERALNKVGKTDLADLLKAMADIK